MKLKTKFSSFQLKPILKRNSDNFDKIKTINFDQVLNQVIILLKQRPNSQSEKITHSVMFFDAKKKEKIQETLLTNQEMIGRLKSGLF